MIMVNDNEKNNPLLKIKLKKQLFKNKKIKTP